MRQYVAWKQQLEEGQKQGVDPDASHFYEDLWCQSVYMNFIHTILNRVNTITGVPYRDDAMILGWAPANEPQCHCDPGGERRVIPSWAHTVAAEIKRIDPRHLIFMDCEGFWGASFMPAGFSKDCGGNPYPCGHNGCDFVADCASPWIDVACCHLYCDLWLPKHQGVRDHPQDANVPDDADEADKLQFSLAWLDAHVAASSQRLKKPLVLSEFGKKKKERSVDEDSREVYFKAVLQRCLHHMTKTEGGGSGGGLSGSIFWTAAARSYPDYDGFTVYLCKGEQKGEEECCPTAKVILEHAAAVQALNRNQRSQEF